MITERTDAGQIANMEDGLSRIIAPNPSPMTYWGTNTYLLGHDSLAVIDPGPMDTDHLDALMTAIAGRTVSHIIVTHSHLDHSPLARPLAEHTSAPIYAFGDSLAGRSLIMDQLSDAAELGGGEGVDKDFVPDKLITNGETLSGDGWDLTALHTPGHFGNHMCFLWGSKAFTGDHLMGWATSLVSPPDGDLTDFMASCYALKDTGIMRAYPAHGTPIMDAAARLDHIISHRLSREAQIIDALKGTPKRLDDLTRQIYQTLDPALYPMAKRNVLAHLIDLTSRGIAQPIGALGPHAKFILT